MRAQMAFTDVKLVDKPNVPLGALQRKSRASQRSPAELRRLASH